MGKIHKRHKTINLSYNPKRTKGKKGYKYKKSWGSGKMSLSKHRQMMGGDNKNHADSIARTREFNLEEARYKELKNKRKGTMYSNVLDLFRLLKRHY